MFEAAGPGRKLSKKDRKARAAVPWTASLQHGAWQRPPRCVIGTRF
jgi:hypothetical protein